MFRGKVRSTLTPLWLFCSSFSVSFLDFATSPNSGVIFFGGVTEVGENNFSVHFFCLYVLFLVSFIFLCCRRATSISASPGQQQGQQQHNDSQENPNQPRRLSNTRTIVTPPTTTAPAKCQVDTGEAQTAQNTAPKTRSTAPYPNEDTDRIQRQQPQTTVLTILATQPLQHVRCHTIKPMEDISPQQHHGKRRQQPTPAPTGFTTNAKRPQHHRPDIHETEQ